MSHRHLFAQRGVGIVEVMVAVLVLSIGLLGLAGLQVRTLRNSESSMARGIAVMESHAVADAMRADRDKAMAGAFDLAIDADPPSGSTFADRVLAAWRENLETSLGEDASGSVDCTGTDCTITIEWNDTRGSARTEDLENMETFKIVTQEQL